MPCRPRKNVSFHGQVRVQSVPSLDDFSNAEHRAAWYSSYDLGQFRSRERQMKSNESSLRQALRTEIGLESKMERQRRRARVDIRLSNVLDEQDRQWQDDSNNPERLAKISSVTSQESMQIALLKARQLERQVQERKTTRDGSPTKPRSKSPTPPLARIGRSVGAMRTANPFHKSSVATNATANATWSVQPEAGVATSSSSSRLLMARRLVMQKYNSISNNKTNSHITTASSSPPQSSSANSNQRWQVTQRDDTLSPPQRQKYNLQKLAGLVGVPAAAAVQS